MREVCRSLSTREKMLVTFYNHNEVPLALEQVYVEPQAHDRLIKM